LAITVVGVLGTAPASARARRTTTPISCGQEVTTSIVVANDLSCTTTPILQISGEGVTVDLRGHTITGGGTGSLCGDLRFGSCALELHDGVTLTNGRLRNVQLGVLGGTATKLELRDGSTVDMNGGQFGGGRVFDGSVNIYGAGSTLAGNRLVRTGTYLDDVRYSLRDLSIADNIITDGSASFGSQTAAILVRGSAFLPGDISGEIVRNRISGSKGDGIALVGSQIMFGSFRIEGNRVRTNAGNGITVLGSGAPGPFTGGPITIRGNEALRNGGHGLEISTTTATIVDGGGNVARRNQTDPQCIGVTCLRTATSTASTALT
jgi:hypothetical protein